MNSMNPSNPVNLGIHIIFIAIIFILFIACYHDVLLWMYGRCRSADSYYSHAFLIPFVSGFLVWQKRQRLKALSVGTSWWGLALIVFAALLHIAGTTLYVFSISGFSIFFLLIGLCLYIYGKEITREIAFPLLFLVFMFPLPLAVISAISFPMKVMAVKAGAAVVSAFGAPVTVQGFHVSIPSGELLVGNPCSGLRSLISFLALGALFAYVARTSMLKRMLLFLLSVPVAVLSNLVRVPMLILIAHFLGIKEAAPDSWVHTASGMFVFAIGLSIMFGLSQLFQWKS
jgi:exosortase A